MKAPSTFVQSPRIGETIVPMEGVRAWRNPGNNFFVAEIHYTADPARRGDWKYREAPAYGGLASWRWRKEQEIDWDALSGKLVFDTWLDNIHIIKPIIIPEHWPRWVLVDPGWTNPTSVLWVAVDVDADPNTWGHLPVHVYREWYHSRRTSVQVVNSIWTGSQYTNQAGHTEVEAIEQIVVDPGAKQEHQSAAQGGDKVNESAETVFQQMTTALETTGWNVTMDTGNNHKNESIEELIQRLGNWWCDHRGIPYFDDNDNYRQPTEGEILAGAYLEAPTIYFHQGCPKTIREMRIYRWRDWSSSEVRENRNDPETPVDKDDHSITNLIRFMNLLRDARGTVDEESVDLTEFTSRFEEKEVVDADEIAKRHHERRAARFRQSRRGDEDA